MTRYTSYARQLPAMSEDDATAERLEKLFNRPFEVGDRVRHMLAPSLGVGVVKAVDGDIFVAWPPSAPWTYTAYVGPPLIGYNPKFLRHHLED